MKSLICFRTLLILSFIVIARANLSAQIWTVLAADPKGDGKDPSFADAASLSYRYDKQEDQLWFRIGLYGAPNPKAFGVNLVFDTGEDSGKKTNWWGANKVFAFDKILTVWVTQGDNGYVGTIGIGDAAGVKARQITNLLQNNLQIRTESNAIVIGVKRTDITDKMTMKLIAAVGSNERWNDDIPNVGSAAIDLTANRSARGLREIDTSRDNFNFPTGYKTLPDEQPPPITKRGHGKQTFVLIPGVYSGLSSFDQFIARNESRYTFYVLTPPGINGTPARAMPAGGLKLGERPWTRLLERDIRNLIKTKKLKNPVIMTDSHPGSTAAVELAIEDPADIGGVVIVGTNLVQFLVSPKDSTRRTPVRHDERVDLVEDGWASQWFKFVTPETWNSNDMRPEMLSSDVSRGQKAVEEIEKAPLEVKIRYLCEFWASDVTIDFDKLKVPILVLAPGFDEKYLADPANTFAKVAYVDLWDTLIPKNQNVEVVKVPNARLMVLDDQPARSDEAIARFTDHLRMP